MSVPPTVQQPDYAAPRLTPGDLAGLLASFNEVTSRLERTHEELKAEVTRLNRELGEANSRLERSRRLAALGEMAAGIAHEVRNPLGSIRLYARMLEQDLADRPREAGVAGKIQTAAVDLDRIVRDVLAFSREFRLDRAQCHAGELFDRALEACLHDGVPGWRNVRVVRAYERRGPVALRADAGLLTQALTNLVRNAIEAMAEAPGRDHRLELDAIPADDEGPGWVRLRVTDSGPGVTPDVVARMFNPFFTTRASGTGLGLAIVHRIADAHAGRVAVRNNSEARPGGPGATVELILPAACEAGSAERVNGAGEGVPAEAA